MTFWEQLVLGGALGVAAFESWQARSTIDKVQKQLDRMHDHLLKLMRKQGVDPLE